MLKWLSSCLLAILLTLVICLPASAQTNQQCIAWAVWKEARGEGILTQKSVMDVVHNRSKASGKDVCTVLRAYGAFPYFEQGVGAVPRKFLTRLNMLRNMSPVMPRSVMYFNSIPPEYGKRHIKLGGLYFNREK